MNLSGEKASFEIDSLQSAGACAKLRAPGHCIKRLNAANGGPDILNTARIAGILAAKRTGELLPLCDVRPIYRVDVRFEMHEDAVHAISEVESVRPGPVDMEAMLAATVAALVLFDALKPYCEPDELLLAECRLIENAKNKGYRTRLLKPLGAAVIMVSSAVLAGRKPDTAGKQTAVALEAAGFGPVNYDVIADDSAALRATVMKYAEAGATLIVTVGGTGVTSGDITVDTITTMITHEMPGVMEAARAYGQRRTPFALMSRGTAGVIGSSTMVVTCPGSRRGAAETMTALLPGLIHLCERITRKPAV